MTAERLIGVDFGTSTSVIRVKRYQSGHFLGGDRLTTGSVVFHNSFPMVPTLIQKMGEHTYFGYDAQVAKKGASLFHGFKVNLEHPDPVIRQEARNLTQEFLTYLADSYRTQSEGGHLGDAQDRERTLISYPVKWSTQTKKFMIKAAQTAGFPHVEGMDEAQAAIHAVTLQNEEYLKNKGYLQDGKPCTLLLMDMGAGTTDLVLCRYTPGEIPVSQILSTWPRGGDLLFGGREVEQILQNYVRGKLPEEMADVILKKCSQDKFKAWKENVVSPALVAGDTVESFADLDMITELLDQEMLPYHLNRRSFEECAREYLKQFPKLVKGCVTDAGIEPGEVELVVLTGGHSQWYFVKELLAGRSPESGDALLPQIAEGPERVIPVSRPQETVALGLVYTPMKAAFTRVPVDKEPLQPDDSRFRTVQTKEETVQEETERQVEREPVSEAKSLSRLAEEFLLQQDFIHPGSGDFSVKNMAALRECLGIPYGEKVFLACDTTWLGSGKHGYAFTERGIYSRVYETQEVISWEEFTASDFQPLPVREFGFRIGTLTLCHSKKAEPYSTKRMICELQNELRKNSGND